MFARAARFSPTLKHARETRPIPIVGGSAPAERSKVGPQRSINWFPVKPERDGEEAYLRGRPGLELLVELPRSPIRGLYVHEYRLFVVAGARVYEVDADGDTREWGTIPTSSGRVGITSFSAPLGDTLIIGDGAAFYAVDLNTAIVTTITDAPRGRYCITFNQRIVYQGENGQVFYSEVSDPTNIPGANFFTAESLSDTVVAITATEDQVWLHGEDSTEVWFNTGDANNPFQRISGGVLYSGCLYPATALRVDHATMWVDRNKDGLGIVYRTSGFSPVRVSTSPVERFIAEANIGGLSAYSYQEDGHTFYCLNALGQNTGGNQNLPSWCLDLKTGEWHERAWLNRETGIQERHRVEFHANAYGKNIVGDYESGKIYVQSLDIHSDDGQEIRRTRVTPRFGFSGRSVIMDEVWLDFATAVGLDGSGQGTDPQVMLRVSGDGASFGSEMTCPLGKIGEYDSQVRFFGLGLGRDWVFEISVSDPVFTALMGGEANMRVGRR